MWHVTHGYIMDDNSLGKTSLRVVWRSPADGTSHYYRVSRITTWAEQDDGNNKAERLEYERSALGRGKDSRGIGSINFMINVDQMFRPLARSHQDLHSLVYLFSSKFLCHLQDELFDHLQDPQYCFLDLNFLKFKLIRRDCDVRVRYVLQRPWVTIYIK